MQTTIIEYPYENICVHVFHLFCIFRNRHLISLSEGILDFIYSVDEAGTSQGPITLFTKMVRKDLVGHDKNPSTF